MGSIGILVFGVILCFVILGTIPKIPSNLLRGAAALGAMLVIGIFALASSYRFVGENEVGVVVKNIGFTELPPGQIIAMNGEKGPQAQILPPGWHSGYWPIIFDVEVVPILEVKDGMCAILTALDGKPMPSGQSFAAEWETADFQKMINDATYFLGPGNGIKGPQASILTPGKYRFNPKLFTVEQVPATNIEKATVAVIKSNVGSEMAVANTDGTDLVKRGERGIWAEPYLPQKIYLNTKAYEPTIISTRETNVRYGIGGDNIKEEQEIDVRTMDGFTFPVDVRIVYQIKPEDAPRLVAQLGDDQESLQRRLASTVRAIFRNNAENVKALDYVRQRSHQEESSSKAIAEEMINVGVTVKAVFIGQIGDEATLGPLLKTQTDREIALQESLTFEEQQRTQEKKKELSRTEQEAEEEKRLATATYEVKIAEQDKEKRIIEASAEAEAILIKAEAQAEAYKRIALEIGKGNAALIELLKIIGESGINITPRVMINGNAGGSSDGTSAETTALIGTMLDSMISDKPDEQDNVAADDHEDGE